MSNEQKWTQARWRVDDFGDEIRAVVDGFDVVVLTRPKTVCHGSTMTGAWMETEGQEADLHRAAECVNFLAAHPDLSKVEVVSKEEMARHRSWWQNIDVDEFAKLRASHANLLKALRNAADDLDSAAKQINRLCHRMGSIADDDAEEFERAVRKALREITNAEAIK